VSVAERRAAAPVYLGTSEFAAEVLSVLAASGHRPSLVVTPPDRRRGRGRRLSPPPVAALAVELGLPLLQCPSVNEPEPRERIAGIGSGVAMVCAFGQLIKEPLLDELPMLNVHPSLLPRWRGAAPIERAIMAGDERTGVCVIRLTSGLDSGPIAVQRELVIGSEETYGQLAPRLARLGGELAVEALDLFACGELKLHEQPADGVTYAEKISREDRRLAPSRPAAELARTVRALTPHIGAFLELSEGARLGVRRARPIHGELAPGEVGASDGRLLVGCAEGVLAIDELQPPGGRAMAVADYLRGHKPPDSIPLA
jgi:methionyl-tRNA formyltransferase